LKGKEARVTYSLPSAIATNCKKNLIF
jgi:hypothetical protein